MAATSDTCADERAGGCRYPFSDPSANLALAVRVGGRPLPVALAQRMLPARPAGPAAALSLSLPPPNQQDVDLLVRWCDAAVESVASLSSDTRVRSVTDSLQADASDQEAADDGAKNHALALLKRAAQRGKLYLGTICEASDTRSMLSSLVAMTGAAGVDPGSSALATAGNEAGVYIFLEYAHVVEGGGGALEALREARVDVTIARRVARRFASLRPTYRGVLRPWKKRFVLKGSAGEMYREVLEAARGKLADQQRRREEARRHDHLAMVAAAAAGGEDEDEDERSDCDGDDNQATVAATVDDDAPGNLGTATGGPVDVGDAAEARPAADG
jgi:cation transport regulator ChaB